MGIVLTEDNSSIENEELSRIVKLSLLYDFYGALLKEHKRAIFEDYILNDYSLSEIAKEQGMSRQGVHDIVKRCSNELVHYEEKLQLVEKFYRTKQKIQEIHVLAGEIIDNKDLHSIYKIIALSDDILEEM